MGYPILNIVLNDFTCCLQNKVRLDRLNLQKEDKFFDKIILK